MSYGVCIAVPSVPNSRLLTVAWCLNRVLNVRALSLVGKFNQEKALVGALSVILKLCVIIENLCVKL